MLEINDKWFSGFYFLTCYFPYRKEGSYQHTGLGEDPLILEVLICQALVSIQEIQDKTARTKVPAFLESLQPSVLGDQGRRRETGVTREGPGERL